jgi:hypothetical protein
MRRRRICLWTQTRQKTAVLLNFSGRDGPELPIGGVHRGSTAGIILPTHPIWHDRESSAPPTHTSNLQDYRNVGSIIARIPRWKGEPPPRLYHDLWLANCHFAHDSSEFLVLLPFFDAPSAGSFHPFHRFPGPLARTWRRPFPSCGVASPVAGELTIRQPQGLLAANVSTRTALLASTTIYVSRYR